MAALCGPNSPEYVVAMLALHWQSVALAPLPPTTPAAQLASLLARAEATLAFTSPQLASCFEGLCARAADGSAPPCPTLRLVVTLGERPGNCALLSNPPLTLAYEEVLSGGARLAWPLAAPDADRSVEVLHDCEGMGEKVEARDSQGCPARSASLRSTYFV